MHRRPRTTRLIIFFWIYAIYPHFWSTKVSFCHQVLSLAIAQRILWRPLNKTNLCHILSSHVSFLIYWHMKSQIVLPTKSSPKSTLRFAKKNKKTLDLLFSSWGATNKAKKVQNRFVCSFAATVFFLSNPVNLHQVGFCLRSLGGCWPCFPLVCWAFKCDRCNSAFP